MKNKVFALIILFIVLLNQLSFVQGKNSNNVPDYKPFIEKYRKLFSEEIIKNNVKGLSIAIVDGDSIVWCEGFGYYNEKEKKKVTGHTPFHIGSICKTFTGLAVLQLNEQRKLNIDEPFRKYVPEFSLKSRFGPIDSIKIRSMMTHHAGIPDFIKDKFMETPPYFTKVLGIVNEDYVTFPPNTIFSYSNSGISLLGNLIEKVTNESYFEYVQKKILAKMDMTESGFVVKDIPESVDFGYNSKGEEMKELLVFDAPAGSIYSTANDMAKYIKTMLNKGTYYGTRLIGPATFNEMSRIQNSGVFLDFGNPVGLIWSIYFNDAGKCIEHAGGTLNHRAELCIAPDTGIGIIIMSNSSNGGKSMYRENYEMFSEIMKLKGIKPIINQKPTANILHENHNFVYSEGNTPKFAGKAIEGLEKYTGKYGTLGMYFNIELREGRLWTNIWGQNWYLHPVDNEEFVSATDTSNNNIDLKTRYYFENVDNNLVFIQTNEWGSHQVFGVKMVTENIPSIWSVRTGNYTNDGENKTYQMFSDFSLHVQDNVLFIKCKINIELGPPELIMPLRIINDRMAVVYGYGRFCGQSVQFVENKDKKEIMKFMGFNCLKR